MNVFINKRFFPKSGKKLYTFKEMSVVSDILLTMTVQLLQNHFSQPRGELSLHGLKVSIQNCSSFNCRLWCENRKKSSGAKSGEYDELSRVTIHLQAINCFTTTFECG